MPFKKLLYGLLILSVLSTEGSAFINKVTAPLRGCFIDYYETGNFALRLQNEQGRIENAQKSFNSQLSLEEILKSQSGDNKSFYTFECLSYNGNSRIYTMVCLPESCGYRFESAFPGTDASPPVVVIM